MRRPWIKIEVSTPDKPEVCTIATRLRIDPDAVMGKLVRLWSWAELNGINANDLGVTKEFINKVCGRKNFAEALLECGWLIESEGTLSFPHFSRHNGNASKVRGLTARRVEKHRKTKQAENSDTVTKRGNLKTSKPIAPSVNAPVKLRIKTSKALETNDLETETNAQELRTTATPPPLTDSAPLHAAKDDQPVIEETLSAPRKRKNQAVDPLGEQPLLF